MANLNFIKAGEAFWVVKQHKDFPTLKRQNESVIINVRESADKHQDPDHSAKTLA